MLEEAPHFICLKKNKQDIFELHGLAETIVVSPSYFAGETGAVAIQDKGPISQTLCGSM